MAAGGWEKLQSHVREYLVTLAQVPAPLATLVLDYARSRFAFYIVGGYGDVYGKPGKQDYLSDVYGWSEDDERWVPMPTMHQKRCSAAIVLANGSLFAIGGCPEDGGWETYLDTAETLPVERAPGKEVRARQADKSGELVDETPWRWLPRMARTRVNAHAAVLNGQLYVFGGFQEGAPPAEVLARRGWEEDKEFGKHIRPAEHYETLCAVDHKQGRVYFCSSNSLRVWDAVARKWGVSLLPEHTATYIGRNSAAAFLHDRLYVWSPGQLVVYDPGHPELGWQAYGTPSLPGLVGLSSFSLLPHNGQLYLLGGGTSEQRKYDTAVYRYDPPTRQWEEMDRMALPTARIAFASVSLEQEGHLNEETRAALRRQDAVFCKRET